MDHLYHKTLIIKLNSDSYCHFIQLIESSGYKVEIQKRSNIETYKGSEFTELTLSRNRPTVNTRDNALVQDTCLYIQKNLNRKFMLDELATKMGSNRSKLAATFKQVLGVSVFEWVRKNRMLKAKTLLIESQLSIQEIGFEVGYENCANFSTAFKKYFKISPRQQRKSPKI